MIYHSSHCAGYVFSEEEKKKEKKESKDHDHTSPQSNWIIFEPQDDNERATISRTPLSQQMKQRENDESRQYGKSVGTIAIGGGKDDHKDEQELIKWYCQSVLHQQRIHQMSPTAVDDMMAIMSSLFAKCNQLTTKKKITSDNNDVINEGSGQPSLPKNHTLAKKYLHGITLIYRMLCFHHSDCNYCWFGCDLITENVSMASSYAVGAAIDYRIYNQRHVIDSTTHALIYYHYHVVLVSRFKRLIYQRSMGKRRRRL
jgi:hypothetical protein